MNRIRTLLIFIMAAISCTPIMARVGGFNRQRLHHTPLQSEPASMPREYEQQAALLEHLQRSTTAADAADEQAETAAECHNCESEKPTQTTSAHARPHSTEDHFAALDQQNRVLRDQLSMLEEEIRYLRDENRALRFNLSRINRKKQRLAAQLAAQLEDERNAGYAPPYHYGSYSHHPMG